MQAANKARMDRLIEQIAAETEATAFFTGRQKLSPLVMTAMARVPRHEFIPESYRVSAYLNVPLPIGHGQTISQPYIVALMTDLLDLNPEDTVLEIGTGCGYQAAVLAEIVPHVPTVEMVPALAAEASQRLRRLGYGNISVKLGQGRLGWPEHSPFDAIIVTAASDDVPQKLIEQLRAGGRMVIPVNTERGYWGQQDLLRLNKRNSGEISRTNVLPVAFVPLIGRD
ncbi:MAG: protein-L-isoaspartate(D-aspartate) O-methyltransferase [Alphaproteobacteria bacterium]|nr:protein-L-isoaspartate(D-aspartate) O-methyltransferase [Alphaproteobacteria bacterium]